MLKCIGLPITTIHKHVKMLSYCVRHFSFQLLKMLGNQMDPQPSCSQCSYPLPGDSMAPSWTPRFQLVLHPAPGHPASSPCDLLWSNHRPFPNYLSTAHTCLSFGFCWLTSLQMCITTPSPSSMFHYLSYGPQNFLPHPIVFRLHFTFLWGCELLEDKVAGR